MLTFLAVIATRLLDPLAIGLCGISAALIGSYRVAIPVGAALYIWLMIWLSNPSIINIATAAIAGSLISAVSLWIWRKIPSSFKRAMTKD